MSNVRADETISTPTLRLTFSPPDRSQDLSGRSLLYTRHILDFFVQRYFCHSGVPDFPQGRQPSIPYLSYRKVLKYRIDTKY